MQNFQGVIFYMTLNIWGAFQICVSVPLIDLQERFRTKSVDKKVRKSRNKATSTVVTNYSISRRSSMIALVCLNFLFFFLEYCYLRQTIFAKISLFEISLQRLIYEDTNIQGW